MGTILAILIAKLIQKTQEEEEEKTDGLAEFENVAETTVIHTSTLYKNIQRVYNDLSRHTSVKNDPFITCKLFYKIQTMHTIGSTSDTVKVPVYLTDELHKDWKPHIEQAINEINLAAPGLFLHITMNRQISRVIVERSEHGCYTQGNILEKQTCHIWFEDNLSGSCKGTSVHELLHALGFQHEMKQMYASLYVNITCEDPEWIHQYKESDEVKGITRFDPLSIMMYHESADLQRKNSGDPVWKLKNFKSRSQVMSKLDKVGLNLLYRPCQRRNYNPEVKGLVHYCGRQTTVTVDHNNPCVSFTDGRCGPHNGPNCPACRVLIVPDVKDQIRERWQGWSGLFYCGDPIAELKKKTGRQQYPSTGEIKQFELGGICGPNNGSPCNACGQLLARTYDVNGTDGPWPTSD